MNDDDARMYATVGIENMSEDAGTRVHLREPLPGRCGADLGRARDPVQHAGPALQPRASGLPSSAAPAGHRASVSRGNRPTRGRVAATGSIAPRATAAGRPDHGALDSAAREFLDRTASPDSTYSYRVGSLDPVGRETLARSVPVRARRRRAACDSSLEARTPNPFSDPSRWRTACRAAARFSPDPRPRGRLVRELVGGRHDAGSRTASWDGRDAQGRELPSGVYLCTFRAGGEQRTLKITMLR